MSGSVFGNIFKVVTWGESHGPALGAVIDGCPAGLALSEDDLQPLLDMRRPGKSAMSTSRSEADKVTILSGVFEGLTTGTPISLIVYNEDQRSRDYSDIAEIYRPGHADYTFDMKYGIRDYRGGGRSSGRETLSRVAAGAVALKLLNECGINITAYSLEIGGVSCAPGEYDEKAIMASPLYMPDPEASRKAEELVMTARNEQDSLGGVIECRISGLMPGIGEPVFDKLDAQLAKSIMSIGAVKGLEIGEGFHAALLKGSENNDPFFTDESGEIKKASNHSGGTLGGISDGSDIVFRAAVKPTPSISQPQKTVKRDSSETEMIIKGRHDPVIVPRAVPVVKAMCALTIADAMLMNMASRVDNLRKIYP